MAPDTVALMRMRPLVGVAERRTLEILDRTLRNSHLRAFSKVRLCDVIEPSPGEEPGYEDRNFLLTAHLDFVVYERPNMLPRFAVEFDGPGHTDPVQVQRDLRKNRLCTSAEMPLLRIGWTEVEPHERVSVLQYMLVRYLAWPRTEKRLLGEIDRHLENIGPDAAESLFEGGILDPSIDPTFLFDLEYPFPGISRVTRRLLQRHRIVSDYLSEREAESARHRSRLRCHWVGGEMSMPGYHVLQTRRFVVAQAGSRQERLERRGGSWVSHGGSVLYETEGRFSMQWALPLMADHDVSEPWVSYYEREGHPPYAYADLPGVFLPNVAKSLATYMGLRDVEDWAERANLGTNLGTN